MSNSINIGKGEIYCGGSLVGNIAGIDEEVNKPKNTVTVGIEMVGYEKMKQELRNLEATLDRVLEKQEIVKLNFIGIDLASGKDWTGYSNK